MVQVNSLVYIYNMYAHTVTNKESRMQKRSEFFVYLSTVDALIFGSV